MTPGQHQPKITEQLAKDGERQMETAQNTPISHCGGNMQDTRRGKGIPLPVLTVPTQTRFTDYQAFPTSGQLLHNLDLDHATLMRKVGDQHAPVYCYVLTTVTYDGTCFRQFGSAPNFQGGLMTLCTCKGQMRASKKETEHWPGTWIAGMTGAKAGPGRGYIFYLMHVEYAFGSQRDLWTWLAAHKLNAANAKAADMNPLGDVYRPKEPCEFPYNPNAYVTPRSDHAHVLWNGWRQDITAEYFGRHPALLVGRPASSFLWSKPLIKAGISLGRGYKKTTLHELLTAPHEPRE